ncbi:response regulator transcription factor [Solibacillus sp. FSL K6-1523]|uniref:response regulator transcription factor n=1 Tax=Solibacillus sp. FSL K6-1523 TaxID=2921471 RepID=UPI0030F67615
MIGITSWENDLEKIKSLEDPDKKIKLLMENFLSTFSLEEALLFRYSPIDHLAEGIFSATAFKFRSITSVRDDITTIPPIFEAIQKRNPQYYEGNDFHLYLPRKYVIAQTENALLVVPIIFNSVVIGYFLSTKFKQKVDSQMLMEAELYTKKVGEILFTYPSSKKKDEIKLSKREYEVMRCIAFGHSSKQVASLLEISETTIKQYIKSVMVKTNTLNRTHAVAFLYQNGILN